MTRDEANRKLAEWLGYRLIQSDGWWRIEDFTDPVAVGTYASGGRSNPQWPDFYSDETANARLPEKMPFGVVGRRDDGTWECNHYRMRRGFVSIDSARKTAICNAALALIEKEGVK